MLKSAWFIARYDLAYMLRQKETILWVFIMPFIFFYFIGTVTGGAGSMGMKSSEPTPLAVIAPTSGSFLINELFAALEDENYEIVRVENEQQLEGSTRRLYLPEPAPGYATLTESLQAGNQAVVRVVRDGSGTMANLDQVRLGRAVYGLLADLVALEANGQPVTLEAIDELQAMPRSLTLRVEPAGQRREIPSGYSQTIPGTMVMFTLLVLLTSGSIMIVIEREKGLLRRLASAPISRVSIVFGKWMGRMVLAFIQIGFAMLAGTWIFGMDWGSDLAMVCVVLTCWAAFCTSAALFFANLARNEGQMAATGVVLSMLLAALGGCWWPIEVTSGWMQALAQWIPTGWTMDAMHQLINFGNGPAAALPAVGLLLSSALVLGLLAARNFRYR